MAHCNTDELLENNFCIRAKYFADINPNIKISAPFGDGSIKVSSKYNTPIYNLIAGVNKNIGSDKILSTFNEFHLKKLPFYWWVRNGNDTLYRGLGNINMHMCEEELAMGLSADKVDSVIPPHIGINVSVVDNVKKMVDYGIIADSQYKVPQNDMTIFYTELSKYYLPLNINKQPLKMFIAYKGDAPVAISSFFCEGDFGAVYNVIVHPGHRRQGLGMLMAKVAAKEIKKKGCKYIGLYGTPEGVPLYEVLGFKKFGKTFIFTNRHLL